MSVKTDQIHEPLIRMSKRSGISTGLSIAIRLAAVVLALIVSGLVIFAIVKLNPVDVYIAMYQGAFGTAKRA